MQPNLSTRRQYAPKLSLVTALTVCTAQAAQSPPPSNVEFIAAGLEEHVGTPNDTAELKIYKAGATEPLHKVQLTVQRGIKGLLLAPGTSYRISFETLEPDEQGSTRCGASGDLEVAADQKYRVALTTLKATCSLNMGRVDAAGTYQETAAVEGTVRRQPKTKAKP